MSLQSTSCHRSLLHGPTATYGPRPIQYYFAPMAATEITTDTDDGLDTCGFVATAALQSTIDHTRAGDSQQEVLA